MAKRRATGVSIVLGFCAALAGCGPAADSGAGGRGHGNSAGGTGGAGGGQGGHAGVLGDIDQPDDPVDFGGAGGSSGAAGAAGSDNCEVGVFCPPDDPDGEECGSLKLEGDVTTTEVPGNVLLVFDRSFSMDMDWNGMPRWQAAGSAMLDALTPIAEKLTIGMVGFPSPDPEAFALDCTVLPIESPDQITFKPGAEALTELASGGVMGVPKYDPIRMPALGATPTSEGIQMADAALNGATLTGATAVVLITDGEPNCMWDQAMTVGTIGRWLSEKNIKTYVVGLPGVGGMGPDILEALAVAGGTAPYLTPTNSAELAAKMAEIVLTTVSVGFNSCTIALDPKADLPDKLQMVVEEAMVTGKQQVPHDLGNGAGWTINADGTQVELTGQVCADAMEGRFTSLTFEYGCVELPPIVIEPPM